MRLDIALQIPPQVFNPYQNFAEFNPDGNLSE